LGRPGEAPVPLLNIAGLSPGRLKGVKAGGKGSVSYQPLPPAPFSAVSERWA